jgi:hypothetical protein
MDIVVDVAVNNFLSITGSFLLVMIVLTPVWDASRLLWSSTYVYFLGRFEAFSILALCVVIVSFFITAMLLVERFGHVEVKTDNIFVYLFTSTITVLGLSLLFFSVPLHHNTKAVIHDLTLSCTTGIRTSPLHSYYHVLLEMRQKKDCINLPSIEKCKGYEERAPFTQFLKDMELRYQCSGFCYEGNSSSKGHAKKASLAEVDTSFLSLLQGQVQVQHGMIMGQARNDYFSQKQARNHGEHVLHGRLISLLKEGAESARKQAGHGALSGEFASLIGANSTVSMSALEHPTYGDTANNMEKSGWMNAYPPTLFTNANFKTTCEGAAARDLQFSVMDIASLMYLEGATLLLISVIVGFLKLSTMCGGRKLENVQEKAPESSQYYEYTNAPAKKVVL